MRIFLLGILLFLGLNLNASNDANNTQPCHMDGLYKVCGKQETPLDFLKDKRAYYTSYGNNDDPVHQLCVLVRHPKDATGPDTDEYFIVDYKNMMVYDNKCLGGNDAFVKKGILYFYKWGSGDKLVFKKESFDHCKQPIKEWLKKPYNP